MSDGNEFLIPARHPLRVSRSTLTRFEKLPSPLDHLPADALKAVAKAHQVLAALARNRAAEMADRERVWGKPSLRFSKAATERQKKRLAQISRDREIMRLARRGLTNAVIGARVGLHPVTVSKIVQRILKGNG
jgi:DNA-binding NarL/FixJ family response regulator